MYKIQYVDVIMQAYIAEITKCYGCIQLDNLPLQGKYILYLWIWTKGNKFGKQ